MRNLLSMKDMINQKIEESEGDLSVNPIGKLFNRMLDFTEKNYREYTGIKNLHLHYSFERVADKSVEDKLIFNIIGKNEKVSVRMKIEVRSSHDMIFETDHLDIIKKAYESAFNDKYIDNENEFMKLFEDISFKYKDSISLIELTLRGRINKFAQ